MIINLYEMNILNRCKAYKIFTIDAFINIKCNKTCNKMKRG